jgi:hypothetical protein
MTARSIISRSSYGPGELKVLFQAFDETWARLAHHFNEETSEMAREKLANIILSLASKGVNDPEGLKAEAIRIMGFEPGC